MRTALAIPAFFAACAVVHVEATDEEALALCEGAKDGVACSDDGSICINGACVNTCNERLTCPPSADSCRFATCVVLASQDELVCVYLAFADETPCLVEGRPGSCAAGTCQ